MERKGFSVGSLIPGKEAVISLPQKESLVDKPHAPGVIRLLQKGDTFNVSPEKGSLLLNAALKQEQSLDFKCRKGTCGICEVAVQEGMALLSPPNDAEKKKLGASLINHCRLACQAEIIGG